MLQDTRDVRLEFSDHNRLRVFPAVSAETLRINGIYPIIGLCLTVIPILAFPISREEAGRNRERLAGRDKK